MKNPQLAAAEEENCGMRNNPNSYILLIFIILKFKKYKI
jgi:hypothetical protein